MNEIEQLTSAIKALEEKVDADAKLIRTLAKQLRKTRRSDIRQQHEIGIIRRAMFGVLIISGSGIFGGSHLARLGEEDVARFLEIGSWILSGGVAFTAASQSQSALDDETEDEPEDSETKT